MNANNKFLKQWIGPFMIIKLKPPVNAFIKLTAHSKPKLVHFNDIKHYLSQKIYSEEGSGYPQFEAQFTKTKQLNARQTKEEPQKIKTHISHSDNESSGYQ